MMCIAFVLKCKKSFLYTLIIVIINTWMSIICVGIAWKVFREKKKYSLGRGYSCKNFIIITTTLLSRFSSYCHLMTFFASLYWKSCQFTAAIQYRRVEIIKKEGKRERKSAQHTKNNLHVTENLYISILPFSVAQHEDEEEIRKENCFSLIEFQQWSQEIICGSKSAIIFNNLIRASFDLIQDIELKINTPSWVLCFPIKNEFKSFFNLSSLTPN